MNLRTIQLLFFSCIVFSTLLFSSGCGRVRAVYLVPEAVLTWPGLDGIDHVATTSNTLELRGARIEVDLLDPRKTLAEDSPGLADADWDWVQWHDTIEAAFADALYQTRIFSDVAAKSDPGPMEEPDLTMVLALTEWNPGNRWLRYFFGFGLGRTRMQMEAKLLSPKSGKIVFAFADAREHPGGPSTFPIGIKALKSHTLLKEDLNGALIDIQQVLREVTETELEPFERTKTHPRYHPKRAQK